MIRFLWSLFLVLRRGEAVAVYLERNNLPFSRLRAAVPGLRQIGDRCMGLSAVRLSHRQPDEARNLSKNLAPVVATCDPGLVHCKVLLVETVYRWLTVLPRIDQQLLI